MKNFVTYWIPLAVLLYAVLMILGMVVGEVAHIIGLILAVAALLAVGICVYQKVSEIGEKLDKLQNVQQKATDIEKRE